MQTHNTLPKSTSVPEITREEMRAKLMSSLLYFIQIFYYTRTRRRFDLSSPPGRESHYITICRALTKVILGETNLLVINVPPRYGKTEILIHFVCWAMAQFPQSNFIYVSYADSLARKQSQTIRDIMMMPEYRDYFDIVIRDDVSAKNNFENNFGGCVYAVGAGGTITGRGAGVKGSLKFGGAIIIDDIIKPDDATSDVIREGANDWFDNTLFSRKNMPNTPIILIGQRVHEHDLSQVLIDRGGCETVIIPAIDPAGNPLHPEMHDMRALLDMKEKTPYVFAAQYQQDPLPAGGGIFKRDYFPLLDEEPEILTTFVTVDTGETDKDYNDPTVFSFWGIYKIHILGTETNMFGLHWLDCVEIRVEPKDLENEFLQFYGACMRHKVKPTAAAIEKKSTGTTLLSLLKKYQGLQLIGIERTKASGNKATRFLEAQPIAAARFVSLPTHGRHTEMCLKHMSKITANDSHRFDDIADTFYDAVKLALIDKVILNRHLPKDDYKALGAKIMAPMNKIDQLRKAAYR